MKEDFCLQKTYWETWLKLFHMPFIHFWEIKSCSSYSLTWSNWAVLLSKNHQYRTGPSVSNICNPAAFSFVATEFQIQSLSQNSVTQNFCLCPSLCSVHLSIQQHLSLSLQEQSVVTSPFQVCSALQTLFKQLFLFPNPNQTTDMRNTSTNLCQLISQ